MRCLLLAVLALALSPAAAAQDDWPKEIEFPEGTLTVYQPQAESYEGDRLEGRSAVSWSKAGGGPPLFGAVWLSMRVDIDRDERMVYVRQLEVPQVRFPEAGEDEQASLAGYLERELPQWDLPLSMDRLIADLGLLSEADTEGIRHDPPEILYEQEPAVLVRYDGEPRLEPFDGPGGAKLERVVNTPFLVVRDGRTCWLSGGGELWYSAPDPMGPWTPASRVPPGISQLVEPGEGAGDAIAGEGPPPKIVTVTGPAELIVSDGPPSWKPVEGTADLLYMDNSDSSVLLDITTQSYYTVLSGRWYRASYVDDRWQVEFVPNDELPEAFSDIPEDAPTGDVLAHVAGTEQAREAVLDNAIPQTASVKRDDTSYQVSYDGRPDFKAVDGASDDLAYAVNTVKPVFKLHGGYFSCDQGVWYESPSPTGPWRVCADVPDALYSIPPSHPHYNVTYVTVYDVTPQTVIVGYTPGYTGSYYSHGCVVYGTGWHYNPWYGPHYYPRSWTWGMRVHYNPWYGWSFGLTFSNGPFRFSFGWGGGWGGYVRPPYYGGWWGMGGYRPYPRPYPHGGYRKVNIDNSINVNINNPSFNVGNRVTAGNRVAAGNNIYTRPENSNRVASTRDRARPAPSVALDRPNDVFTDRAGNVYKRDSSGGWQERDKGQWKPAEGLDRPTTRPAAPSSRPATRPAVPSTPSTRPSTPSARPAMPASPATRPSTRPSQPQIGRPPAQSTRPQLESSYSSRQRGTTRMGRAPRPSAGARPTPGRR
ncbi:MAG TPA: hypothetical protein VLT32_23205 [Candidatus Sulfomarinibacteraceae bacterium]|nr:hypothetical protein [Candidatus Sulfomarinibacteraceae bacterium]